MNDKEISTLFSAEYLETSRGGEKPLLKMDITRKPDHLVCTVTGTYDLHEAIERFPMIIAACRQTGLSSVLIDYRDLGGIRGAALDVLYAQGIVDFYKQHLSTGGGPLKIAFVAPEPKSWQDGEEIGKDYGLEALTTTDYDEALNWLFNEAPNDEF